MINNASPIEIEIESIEITTIDQLAQSLADHTRLISDEIIMPALKQSKEYKPIIEFFHSVKKHLIHSPDELDQKGPGLSGKFQIPNPKLQTNSKFQISTSSAVFKNVRGGDTLIETLYAFIALQMLPHAVGFFIAGGLADNENIILDPAAGTSAFLWEAVNLAVDEYASRYGKGIAHRFGYHLLLDRVYGFELLPAAYAVSHLKLNLLLKSFNARLNDDERLNIYLTNTLEMEDLEQKPLPGMDVLSEESRRAGAVKKNSFISIIMGNPPYSLSHTGTRSKKPYSIKSREKSWISELLDDYKKIEGKRLEERNLKWLQEDYVRFIRFAQYQGLAGRIGAKRYPGKHQERNRVG